MMTPGPWSPKKQSSYQEPGWVVLWPDKGGQHMRRLDYHGSFTESDAKLIAAAPDLLEALQLFMGTSASFTTATDKHLSELALAGDRMAIIVQKARAAIAKAEGETE